MILSYNRGRQQLYCNSMLCSLLLTVFSSRLILLLSEINIFHKIYTEIIKSNSELNHVYNTTRRNIKQVIVICI